ncbi:glycosyltransferase family 15 protein [Backusella circina FSU 941]|nr:glycosyltransferase family 15 protein [Backusella circina FSU 941]
MKRGVSYLLTLLCIGLFYFGSLYLVSRPSITCLDSSTSERADFLHRDVPELQKPLMEEEEEEKITAVEPVTVTATVTSIQIQPTSFQTPVLTNSSEYTVDLRPTCNRKSVNKNKKEKAVIVILVRNSELAPMRRTLREFEDRFNHRFNYPYVFLNEEPFTEEFKTAISQLTNAEIKFGLVPNSMWSVPSHVNETVMNQQLRDYASRNIMYGGSLSYRHMCRFNSGFFYRHPLLDEYDYYWRVEPGVSFYCDLDYDPFKFMKENGKEYGFTITLKEIPETIPSLWDHTIKFAHQQQLNTTLMRFFGDPHGGYNLCHYWSNFEIASLNLWRDKRYQDYFDYLDSTGNFFYERWGDAIVHSLAAGLFLNKSQVHFFNDIGYRHDNFAHCVDDGMFGKCMCPENIGNFDEQWGSCLNDWKGYNEKPWDFRKNGDQILEFGQVVKKPEHAQ